jgi:Ala-tRNA(Pro) deacylase
MHHLRLFSLFETHGISFTNHTHPPLFSVGDSEKYGVKLDGMDSKNLFLKDKKDNFVLVSVLNFKRVDLKVFSKRYGNGAFSFAKPEDLKEVLELQPGSVTPYGLINDPQHKVKFMLDEDFLKHDLINFHPLRNDMTVSVSPGEFLRFCTVIGRRPTIIQIPEIHTP